VIANRDKNNRREAVIKTGAEFELKRRVSNDEDGKRIQEHRRHFEIKDWRRRGAFEAKFVS